MAAFDANRFVGAQERVIEAVVSELEAGRKLTHWMWFVFPQLAALGRSERARFYGLSGLEDARSYLAHPLLGGRLRQCVGLVLKHTDKSAHDIFGSPDDLKLRSCLTLFREAAQTPEDRTLFQAALESFYDADDPLTLEIARAQSTQNGI
ncbi:MAG: DUF1810 domain-containing protein [Rhodobiaceae bacterium]|nr:DUF1810 domain-containing protein [Rhodobiaceae bacterium]MCC0041425.1 DUF1810 domain-containing protein [Rhodobiaceae bacterium]